MADVARLAGVSAMTVSRALRLEGSVSKRTRARILEVIEEIGYVPDQSAGALSSGRSGLIGAIVPTLSDPIFPLVARGLTDTVAAEGLELFLAFSDYRSDREEEILKAIMRRRPEAVALAGAEHSERSARLLAGTGVPVVEFYDQPASPIRHVVGIDHAAVGRATVRHLVSKGRRRMAFVASQAGMDPRGEARLDGVQRELREMDLPPAIVVRHGGPLHPLDQGRRGAAEVSGRSPEADALICMTDFAAIGALGALRLAGRSAPADIAVIGFGDAEVAHHLSPTLTTFGFNPAHAGVEIGKLLLAALAGVRFERELAPCRIALDFHLIERESA